MLTIKNTLNIPYIWGLLAIPCSSCLKRPRFSLRGAHSTEDLVFPC